MELYTPLVSALFVLAIKQLELYDTVNPPLARQALPSLVPSSLVLLLIFRNLAAYFRRFHLPSRDQILDAFTDTRSAAVCHRPTPRTT